MLDIQPEHPLERVKTNIFYRVILNKEEKRYAHFFVINGNIYFETIVCSSDCKRTADYYCCTIVKLKRFITRANISQFFKSGKKTELETVNDLYIMIMECGYKREIDHNEFCEAEFELKSDFRSRYKFDDFKFAVSTDLNPRSHPGDALITKSRFGAIITLDMISDKRKQLVPNCIKDEIVYFANNLLEENRIDIKKAYFLLHGMIELYVIGTLNKDCRVEIIMIDQNNKQRYKKYFCICDLGKEEKAMMEEYFRNELFPDNVIKITA